MNRRIIGAATIMAAAVFAQGCATKISKPASAPEPASVKFSTFKNFAMKNVVIADKYAESGANKKAAAKIQELMTDEMKKALPGLKVVEDSSAVAKKDSLLIEPKIEAIKFIGGMARFWLGAMAGSSAVRMKVTYTDMSSGKIVADPVFYRKASAFAGGMYGAADNRMLNEVVKDAANYTVFNR